VDPDLAASQPQSYFDVMTNGNLIAEANHGIASGRWGARVIIFGRFAICQARIHDIGRLLRLLEKTEPSRNLLQTSSTS
jgi:hypothetical protein